MDDVVIVEATHHVYDGIHLTDVGEELVAKTLTLGGSAHQTRNIHKFDHGGRVFFRGVHIGKIIHACIRHSHHAHVGLNGAEGIVCRFGTGIGQCVEQCAFSHIREAYDTQFHQKSPCQK